VKETEELQGSREADEKQGGGHGAVRCMGPGLGDCPLSVASCHVRRGPGQSGAALGFSALQQQRCSAGPPGLVARVNTDTEGCCHRRCPDVSSVAVAAFRVHPLGTGAPDPPPGLFPSGTYSPGPGYFIWPSRVGRISNILTVPMSEVSETPPRSEKKKHFQRSIPSKIPQKTTSRKEPQAPF